MTTKLDTLHSQLAGALRRAQKLHTEALPKFNWGASALDAHAIQLLNEVPGDVAAALAQYDAAAAQQAAHTFHVEPTPVLAQGSVTLTLQLTPEWVDSVLCTAIESDDYGWFDWTDIVQGRDPELPSIPTYVSGTCTEYDPDEGTPVDGAQPVLVISQDVVRAGARQGQKPGQVLVGGEDGQHWERSSDADGRYRNAPGLGTRSSLS